MLGRESAGEPARDRKVEDDRNLVVGCGGDRNRTRGHDESLGNLTEPPSGVTRGLAIVFLLALKGESKRSEEGWLSCRKGEHRTRRGHSEHHLAGEGIRGTMSERR